MYEKHTTTRYFRRTQEPTMGILPWGIIGLLLILLPLLFGLFWFAKNTIQTEVQSEIQQELARHDLHWVNVDVSGQGVKLSGEGTKVNGEKAISIAKKVKGDTWLGRLTAPISVKGDFTNAKPAAKPKPVVKSKEATVPIPQPKWGELISNLQSGSLTLTGNVSSPAEKSALLKLAKSNVRSPRLTKVIDKLTISSTPLISGSQALAKRAVISVIGCNSGKSSSINGVYSIDCQASLEDANKIKALASQPLKEGKLGRVIVSTADTCNVSFAKALEGKSIGFAIGSARLKASSSKLIDEIAAIAKACPGTIYVEGHTDDTGNIETNMMLSNARAEAVVYALVTREIKKERLKSQGFGPTKPRADGTSKESRALNRRIEFKVSK